MSGQAGGREGKREGGKTTAAAGRGRRQTVSARLLLLLLTISSSSTFVQFTFGKNWTSAAFFFAEMENVELNQTKVDEPAIAFVLPLPAEPASQSVSQSVSQSGY